MPHFEAAMPAPAARHWATEASLRSTSVKFATGDHRAIGPDIAPGKCSHLSIYLVGRRADPNRDPSTRHRFELARMAESFVSMSIAPPISPSGNRTEKSNDEYVLEFRR
jgi:hypothetical protein